MDKLYVQYGCGHSAPEAWVNYDVSPTLRIQKTPILGVLLKNQLRTHFPPNVKYGNIIKGLPVPDNSCEGVYCSHTLEHLSLNDFRISLQNTYRILKKGGIFRCVVPDLEWAARNYVESLNEGEDLASIQFINNTLLGTEERPRGLKEFLFSFYGNSRHLWMWDTKSLSRELEKVGFVDIRPCKFNDCPDIMFEQVEDEHRFVNAVAIECRK